MCEALANDICVVARGGPDVMPKVKPERIPMLRAIYELDHFKRGENALSRWQAIFKALNVDFDSKNSAAREMDLLVTLRNEFVHAHPALSSIPRKSHAKLKSKLQNANFPLAKMNQDGAFFPGAALTTDAAEWVIRVAGNFCRYVLGELGVRDELSQFLDDGA
jgi:hypothetical protein